MRRFAPLDWLSALLVRWVDLLTRASGVGLLLAAAILLATWATLLGPRLGWWSGPDWLTSFVASSSEQLEQAAADQPIVGDPQRAAGEGEAGAVGQDASGPSAVQDSAPIDPDDLLASLSGLRGAGNPDDPLLVVIDDPASTAARAFARLAPIAAASG